jgi:tetratricopeptide (TPR) repeat protein
MGRVAESRRLSAQALELDRLNPDSYYARFMVLIANRSFEEAIDFTKLVERTRPEMFRWQLEASWCELVLGHPDEAKRYFEQRPSLMGRTFLAIRTKSRPEAELAIAGLRREFGDAASYQYAQIYSGLGDKDRAFAFLDRAWAIRDSGLAWVKVDPFLDPLRSDRRFQAIVDRLDFPT